MIKYVDVWKQTLSVILSLDPVPRNTGVKNLLLVLQYLYNVSISCCLYFLFMSLRIIPNEEFYTLNKDKDTFKDKDKCIDPTVGKSRLCLYHFNHLIDKTLLF